MLDFAQARQLMVDCQLRTFDVNDIDVLDAFSIVPRERFVQPGTEDFAYADRPVKLPIGNGETRTVPAPMILARMIQALKLSPGASVLDVAGGYGYATAVLTKLGAKATLLESDNGLVQMARDRLDGGAAVIEGPLAAGAASAGPFDAILVQGRIEFRPQTLLNQLKDGGRLVCVYGTNKAAKVTLFVRVGDAFGSRPLFDAALPGLPGLVVEPGFTF